MAATRWTYILGWIVAIIAMVYRLLISTDFGVRIAGTSGISPRSVAMGSAMLFLICIASEAYERAMKRETKAGPVIAGH